MGSAVRVEVEIMFLSIRFLAQYASCVRHIDSMPHLDEQDDMEFTEMV